MHAVNLKCYVKDWKEYTYTITDEIRNVRFRLSPPDQ